MKRKIILLLVTLWISIFIISGCSMMPHLNASAQTVIDTKKELLAEIENALSSGKTKISFVTSDLDQTDFDTLNQNIEGFYGVVKEYQIKSVKFLNKSYVTLNCEISDNYYVEKAFFDEEDIPEEREKARDLYEACKSFLTSLQSKKRSDYEKEKLIHDYIVSNVAYGYPGGKKEPEGDAYSAYGALVLKKAVCNGQAFAKSCNTAFVTLGSKLDIKNFVSLNKKCLFNQEIPFDLAVKKSRFELTQNSDKSEIPQTVIGQGNTLMTPFHNALLMCAVANEGTLMKPYVVDHVEGADGTTVKETIPEIYADLMSEKDAKKLQKMLREVVTSGTGYNLDTDLYTAAGKTGTAENEGKYAHAWFVGYSNVEDPDLVVCVLVENVGAGSKYAVPIAKRVFDSYYNNNMKEYYSQKTDIESTQTNQ